ncbi:MAG TPA: hypothetical protein VMP01_17910 [Pirellulaceae bacterium]|nr:hypothetical protein [Pirellulaceae bacterium]
MRFTIRDLLWLTLLAAVLVAWWVDRQWLVQELDWWSGAVEIRPEVWTEF